MKRNWELLFFDGLFLVSFSYGIYRYVYGTSYRLLIIGLSLSIFTYVAYEHYKLYKNHKRIY